MFVLLTLADIALYLKFVLIPILIFYIGYLFVTKAFKDMGFSKFEAISIIVISFLFEFQILVFGLNISDIHLFTYQNWNVGVNMGGAIIPILISIYLAWKKKLDMKKVGLGILIVTVITFFVTSPDPAKGIVSSFPFWLIPAVFASFTSVLLLWKNFSKSAPFAYVCGTIGVLIGADFFHLPELLSYSSTTTINAVIGGANIVDMIFITGIIAVMLDGIILQSQKTKKEKS